MVYPLNVCVRSSSFKPFYKPAPSLSVDGPFVVMPLIFFSVSLWSKSRSWRLSLRASRSQSDPPHAVGLLWTSDQPEAETSTWQHRTLTIDKYPCPHARVKPTIPANEQPQTHAWDRAATRIGNSKYRSINLVFLVGLFPHIGLISVLNEHKLNLSIIAFFCLVSCSMLEGQHAEFTESVRQDGCLAPFLHVCSDWQK